MVIVKLPGVPTVKVAPLALVKLGARLMVKVKVWAASLPTPLWAVSVRV